MVADIRPQPGYQEAFLSSSADIVIGGGAAGAGKTFGLLMDPLRYIDNPTFGAMIFRRTTPQIDNVGGLWEKSGELYPLLSATEKGSAHTWIFPSGARLKMSHLEHEKDKNNYQGAEIAYIGFDELTHFSQSQFFYLLGRNRSMSGVKPCIRATCNPDPDSWVADFLSWWIDPETGYPLPERSGKLRYFTRDSGVLVWGDSYREVVEKCPHIFSDPALKGIDASHLIKSTTFIPGSIYDNRKLIERDPGYLGALLSLEEKDQLRLLRGNWKVRQDGSSLYNYVRLNDLFTNHIEASDEMYITCDVARFGRDFTVIMVWRGWKIIAIYVLTKSKTTETSAQIERCREIYHVPQSSVVVDQDGVGGGVVDEGDYIGFTSNASALEDPSTRIKENYQNLKTQCYYRSAERVNAAQMAIDLTETYVDGDLTDIITIGKEPKTIKSLILDDLRSVKRKNADGDGKKKINSKEEQKNILGGRSPDFGDSIAMRVYFDLAQSGSIIFIA